MDANSSVGEGRSPPSLTLPTSSVLQAVFRTRCIHHNMTTDGLRAVRGASVWEHRMMIDRKRSRRTTHTWASNCTHTDRPERLNSKRFKRSGFNHANHIIQMISNTYSMLPWSQSEEDGPNLRSILLKGRAAHCLWETSLLALHFTDEICKWRICLISKSTSLHLSFLGQLTVHSGADGGENWGGSWQESTYVLAIKSEKEVMNIHRQERFGRRRLLFDKEKSKNDSQLRMMILIHLLIIMTAKRYTCKPFLIRHTQMHTGAKVQSLQSCVSTIIHKKAGSIPLLKYTNLLNVWLKLKCTFARWSRYKRRSLESLSRLTCINNVFSSIVFLPVTQAAVCSDSKSSVSYYHTFPSCSIFLNPLSFF